MKQLVFCYLICGSVLWISQSALGQHGPCTTNTPDETVPSLPWPTLLTEEPALFWPNEIDSETQAVACEDEVAAAKWKRIQADWIELMLSHPESDSGKQAAAIFEKAELTILDEWKVIEKPVFVFGGSAR